MFKNEIRRWSIITFFSGNIDDNLIHLELDTPIEIDIPKAGKHDVFAFDFAIENNQHFISGSIDPEGYFTYNLNQDTLETFFI